MKKKIIALLLAISLCNTMLPLGTAFAAVNEQDSNAATGTNEETPVTIDVSGLIEGTLVSGTGWSFTGYQLTLENGYEFTINNGDCQFYVENKGTIVDGTFKQQVFNDSNGTIRGGIFAHFDDSLDYMPPSITNWGTISGGTFNTGVSVDKDGSINGGTFNKEVMLGKGSSISDGTFNGVVINPYGTIGGGAFNGVVKNYATITGGTFASIEGNGKIILSDGGSFSVKDTSGFSGTVSVDGAEHIHSYTAVYELSQTAGKHYHLSICKGCPVNKVESRTEEACTPGDIATCTPGDIATCTLCKPELVSGENTERTAASDNGQHSPQSVPAPIRYKTTSSVNGITTAVSGVYLLDKGFHVAILSAQEEIAAGYGLMAGERAFAKVMDMDVKKSNQAKKCLDDTTAAYGGVTLGYINMEIGRMFGGKYSSMEEKASPIRVMVNIPPSVFREGAKYAVIRVHEGGKVEFLNDLDAVDSTITFETTAQAAAYAIIEYEEGNKVLIH